METMRQLGFEEMLRSPMERLLRLDQIRYRKPITIAKQFFEYFMQIRPQEEIRITPNYPIGWEAEVVSEDKVWTVTCNRGEIKLTKVGDLLDHTPNGKFITAAKEEIGGPWNDYYQPCQYAGLDNGPLLCTDFCDDPSDDEIRCKCCPRNGET
jgi:hypothetical protein